MVIDCFRVIEVIFSTVRTPVAAADLVRRSQVLHQVLFAFVDAVTHWANELKQKQTAGVSTYNVHGEMLFKLPSAGSKIAHE